MKYIKIVIKLYDTNLKKKKTNEADHFINQDLNTENKGKIE